MSDPEPRLAATLVLMRDSDHGLEILLTLRPEHMRFMPGTSVFPGGAVAASDGDPGWAQASALTAEEAAVSLDVDPAAALAPFICAAREAFEEVGYIAGTGPVGKLQREDSEDPSRFLAACLDREVVLATDAFVPAGRWVTPMGAPVRFDTRFFLTVVPDGWEPVPDPTEVAGCAWETPAAALSSLAAGTRLMVPPTVEMLQRLDGYGTTEEALKGFGISGLRGAGKVLSLRVSPLVHVVLAPNAGSMTGPGTNTYVVGSGPFLLIDPAVDDDDYFEALNEVCADDVSAILITHRHSDHVGGARRAVEEFGAPVHAFGDKAAGDAVVAPVEDGARLSVPGVELRALHTPGHASDHLCFYFEGAASLFAGDNILGEGTAVIAPPDGNMRAYLGSLERLRDLHIDRIYPGHWKPLDGGRGVIDGYLAHRKERGDKIVGALDETPRSLDEIVAVAYADTPPELHPVARFSALAHLEMLVEEGRAETRQDRWRLVTKG